MTLRQSWTLMALAPALLYAQDTVPQLLVAKCQPCHNAAVKQGGLDLSTRASLLRGGDRGPAVVPGNLDESLLYQYVTHRRKPGMPMGQPKLADAELGRIAEWIRNGAPFDALPASAPKPAVAAPVKHWAFQPPQRPAVPRVKSAWARNPIDAFIAFRQQAAGVLPAGEADRHTLLRRVHLDLTGLPPTPAQVRAFLADSSPRAYEKAVDDLLASPQYGERWGRHWMDIWRYSDWYGSGAEIRNSQPHIWRWRDWIVESLNADKGYDRMVHEMLAGDEIAPADPATLRATGFLVRNWFLFNRNVWLQDTIEATTAGFLGVTLKCARCHDHKYDPLAQEDYYRFRAYFEPHDVRIDRTPGEPDRKLAGLARVFEATPRPDLQNAAGTFLNPAIFAETFLFIRGDERQPDQSKPLTPATPPALGASAAASQVVELPLHGYYPDARPFVQQDLLTEARRKITRTEEDIAKARARLEQARRDVAQPPAAYAGARVDFDKEIRPLLETRCGNCHLARNIKSGFNIATAKSVQSGGAKQGAAVVPGKSSESALITILEGRLGPRMPLNGPAMEPDKIALIARWIDSLPPPDPAQVARETEARLAVGEHELRTVRAQLAALEARIAAENARYANPPNPAETDKLSDAARQAERHAGALLAQENALRAQQRLTEALAASPVEEAKVNAARRALEQAVEALTAPKEAFTPLGTQYPKTSSGRRLALARWITDRANPLAARVAVNHMWLRHFGKPLVASLVDFGKNGRAPTHPDLLDWLAVEFMESGWSMKHLHRLMVTSATYRLRSGGPSLASAADKDNHLYWRMNARRLEAEAIRDSVLTASGALDLTQGGPELNEETQATSTRRSLYFRVTPDAQLTFLKVFDGVDPTNCFVRAESVVPQQALALANSRLTFTEAARLAAKLEAAPDFIDAVFQAVLSRPPTVAERTKSAAFLARRPDRNRANLIHALFNRNEFVTLR